MASSFLREIPADLLVNRATARLRGSGLLPDESTSWGARSGARRRHVDDDDRDDSPRYTPSQRRPGVPVIRTASLASAEEESQDLPRFVPGERVQHARFGGGTIAEVSGSGREAKVTIDFDDDEVGRKRLVVAHAGLARGFD
jgi:DNA helicase-2/ATP-dependent DNA helicase PcrA